MQMPENLGTQSLPFSTPGGQDPCLSILYIDEFRLSRDSVTTFLSTYLSNFSIESASTVYDLPEDGVKRFRLAVLHTHAARVGEDKIAGQLTRMSQFSPVLPLVLISDVEDPDVIIEAFRLGARGYITTGQSLLDVADAIRFVDSGGVAAPWNRLTAAGRPVSPTLAYRNDTRPIVKFTTRQIDVLTRVRQGKPNKTIASELGMSESTVKVHIRQLMNKLHASNRTQVALLTRGLAGV
jgi:DNA-binding NarL/FixJ family response regulator